MIGIMHSLGIQYAYSMCTAQGMCNLNFDLSIPEELHVKGSWFIMDVKTISM